MAVPVNSARIVVEVGPEPFFAFGQRPAAAPGVVADLVATKLAHREILRVGVIEIKPAENFMTRYAHLNKRLVSHNSHVQAGSRIGEVGSTGRSTGPHLHYEIFHNGKLINPAKVLPLRGV